jgi:iron complex outermembrane receptor protein
MIWAAGIALTAAQGLKAQDTAASTTPTPTAAAPAATTPANSEVQKMETFTVTGSYLPTSSLIGASPISIIDNTSMLMTGETNVLQVLNHLDTAFTGNGNLGTTANNVGGGGGGESYLALRNLTTLVLLDGNRVAVSAFSGFGGLNSVDVNTIPLGMIDHIETLKDGASIVYGSDAIGGVVNIITKKNYEGLEVFGGYGETTDHGNYITKNWGLTAGVAHDNFSITFGADYYSNNELPSTDRAIATLSLLQIAAAGGEPGGTQDAYYSGSFPGRVGNDILAGSPLAAGAPKYNASITSPVLWSSPSAIVPQTLTQLEAKGTYIPLSTTPLYAQAGNSTAMFNTSLFGTGLVLPDDRRQFLINADDKVLGDQLEFTTEILYSQTINGGDTLAPSPLASLTGNNLIIPANNPYNPFGTLLGVGQASGSPTVRTRLIEVGNRTATNTTDSYTASEHIKGKINDNLSWDMSADYSRSNWLENVYGGANGSVLNQLLTPLLTSSGGYTYDPSTGRPLSVFVDPATGNQDIPVYNYFGLPGSNDPRTIAAMETTLFQSGVSELKNYQAILNGNITALPAGNLTFAAGYQYLRQDLSYQVDGLYKNGLALGYSEANSFAGGTIYSNALFVEFGVPVTAPSQNVPLLNSLDLTFSGRYEKLDTGPKSTVPKVTLKWHPIDDQFTVRATYGNGFISPTTFDLFGPPSSGAPTFTIIEGNGQSNSGGAIAGLPKVTGQFLAGFGTTTSNPALAPSKSETLTTGIAFSPKAIKGLNITLDYYHIRETGIGGTDWTALFNSLNALGSASPYASGFTFQDGSVLKSTTPNQLTSTNVGNLIVPLTETGWQYTDGLDFDVDYTLPLPANVGVTKVGLNGSTLFNYFVANNSSSPAFQYARQYTGGSMAPLPQGNLPGYILKPYAQWSLHGLSASLDVEYLPKVTDSGTLFGGPMSPDYSAPNAETLNGKLYTIPSYITVDLAVNYDLSHAFADVPTVHKALKGTSVTIGVNDMFDKLPPFVPSSLEDNTDEINYSILGRYVFMQISKKF